MNEKKHFYMEIFCIIFILVFDSCISIYVYLKDYVILSLLITLISISLLLWCIMYDTTSIRNHVGHIRALLEQNTKR